MTNATKFVLYTKRDFSITDTTTNEKRAVWHYQLANWSKKQTTINHTAVVELIDVVHKSQSVSGGPIVAHDR